MTKLRLGQIDTLDIESSVFASANTLNTVQSNLTANTYNTYTTLNSRINTVQDNVTTGVANTYNTYINLTANIYNTYTSLSANIDSVQANVYALTLDTVATNGNSTTQSIEVAGLLVNGTTDLTSNVVIRGMIDTVDRIQFNTSVNTDTTAGVFAWNADQGTLQFGLSDIASVHLGQDTFYYVKAGEALSRGNVVYASGAVGNSGHIEVSKFYANNAIDERYVVGVMADDVASGEFGYATVIGTIRGLVADGSLVGETWNLGDVLYPSPTNPGGWTKVQPEAPNQAIPIAFITSNSSSNGSIAIRATSMGYHLGELHDVQTGTESDGNVLTWVSANSRWEPATVASDQSNVYNTYLTLSANDYSTYTTLSSLIDTVQANVDALPDSAANDFSTYTTVTANIYNTWKTVNTAIDTVQANVTALPDSAANDFSTYTTVTANIYNTWKTVNTAIDTVQANVTALPDSAANDFSTYTTVTANIYNTWKTVNTAIDTVQSNVTALPDSAANDFSTYSTLSSLIDIVQDNVSSYSSNTSIVVGGTDLSNTTVFVEAGDGVLLSSNTTSKTLTIATSMSNVTSQTISIDGSANSFTLTKSAANSNMILVMYNGLVQDPARYSISGSTLTLINSAPLIAGANVEVRYFDFFSLPGVSAGGGGGYTFQGSTSGYASGGNILTNVIDKFSLTSDANASDVGDLTIARVELTGQSSTASGYTSGGQTPTVTNVIDKFPFSSDGNATDVGDLTQARNASAGQSSSDSGYTSGGETVNTIDKFPFASDGNATDVGDLTVARSFPTGQSSTSSGYSSGANTPPTSRNVIDKFPFSSDGNATDVGDLTQSRGRAAGQSSSTSGYTSGGLYVPSIYNTIDKFSFSSDGNASDVGDLTVGRYGSTGQSSAASGYTSGGSDGNTRLNTIDKFPFSSDANASDVGDLTVGRIYLAGQQV